MFKLTFSYNLKDVFCFQTWTAIVISTDKQHTWHLTDKRTKDKTYNVAEDWSCLGMFKLYIFTVDLNVVPSVKLI